MSRLILITGGARSGKSDFAQKLAWESAGDAVAFIATARVDDEEMARRIAAHRQDRPAAWQTIEADRDVGKAIASVGAARAVIVDCLTLLVSNVLCSSVDNAAIESIERAVDEEVAALIESTRSTNAMVIVVTNEVGLGIVPDNPLARTYRDLLGRANAAVARAADDVYLLVAGLPVEIKALALRRFTPG